MAGRYPAIITEVRGIGLMLGLKCAIDNGAFVEHLLKEGLLTVMTGAGALVPIDGVPGGRPEPAASAAARSAPWTRWPAPPASTGP